MRSFVNVIKAASVYVDGQNFAGVAAEVTLPEINMMQEDYRGMGMSGAVRRFNGVEPLEASMVFNGYLPEVMKQVGSPDIRAENYSVRWATESFDGERKYGVAEFSGRGSNVTRDALADGEDPVQTTLTIQCVSYKETFDGQVLYDIDVENGKFIVDGTDHWAPLQENL